MWRGRRIDPRRSLRLALVVLVWAGPIGCGEESSSPSDAGTPGLDASSDADAPDAALVEPEVGPRPTACPPGERRLKGGGCQAAGVAPFACGEGFVSDGNGGCDALLPATACAPGEMALPGETECRPVAPCGAGRWGDIPTDESTEYVDGSYVGGDSDGSEERPWSSIQQGISAAAPGATVAVAAGSYAEDVFVRDKPVVLWGKCPAEVEVVGQGVLQAALTVREGAEGTEIRSLAVRGLEMGLLVRRVADVTADQVWVHDASYVGVVLSSAEVPSSLVLSGSLVEQSALAGVLTLGADLTIVDSIVRDAVPDADGNWGRCVGIEEDPDTGASSSFVGRHLLVERCTERGMLVLSSSASIDDSLVRDTGERGISAEVLDESQQTPSLELRRSVVERTHYAAVHVLDGDAVVEHSVMRDNVVDDPASVMGYGLSIAARDRLDARPQLVVRSSLIERNEWMGLRVVGADVLAEGVVIRDTFVGPDGLWGIPVHLRDHSDSGEPVVLTARGLVVERGYGYGIGVSGSDATLESVVVRDIESDSVSGAAGRGLTVESSPRSGRRASLRLQNARVERCREAGIVGLGADVTIEDVTIEDIEPSAAGAAGRGIVLQSAVETGDWATGTIAYTSIGDVFEAGIFVADADAVIEHTAVTRSRPSDVSGLFGDGLVGLVLGVEDSLAPTTIVVRSSAFEENARAGVATFGAAIALSGTRMACNAIDLARESFGGQEQALQDDGGNWCGCGDEAQVCQAVSSGLEPPDPVGQSGSSR
jgi:hypothetical protein